MNRRFILIVYLWLAAPSVFALPNVSPIRQDEVLYSKFCEGKFGEFNAEIKKIPPSQQNYIASRLMAISTREGQAEAFSLAQKLPQDLTGISDVDRLVSASILIEARFPNIARIKELLDFIPQSAITLSYQRSLKSYFIYLEKGHGYSTVELIHAIDELPYLDENMLFKLFTQGMREKHPAWLLTQYFPYIDKISDTSAMKYGLLAYKTMVEDPKNQTQSTALIKKAYEMCEFDEVLVLLRAINLMEDKQYDDAEKILKGYISGNLFYSVYIDLFLAQIYILKNDIDSAKPYLQRAQADQVYLSVSGKWKLNNLQATVKRSRNKKLIMWGALILVIFGFGISFMWSKRKPMPAGTKEKG